jgi:hypothetical protein
MEIRRQSLFIVIWVHKVLKWEASGEEGFLFRSEAFGQWRMATVTQPHFA